MIIIYNFNLDSCVTDKNLCFVILSGHIDDLIEVYKRKVTSKHVNTVY